MSKAVQTAVAILAVLLIVCAGFAVYALLQKGALEKENQNLQAQIADSQDKADKLLQKAKNLEKAQQDLKEQNESLSQKLKEKDQLQASFDDLKNKSDDLNNQISQMTQERDDFKNRLETIRKERDELMDKIRNQPNVDSLRKERDELAEKVKSLQEAKDNKSAANPDTAASGDDMSAAMADGTNAGAPSVTSPQGDQYWASILKQKAALQLDLEKAKTDLDQSALQIVELKKQNAEMQMELKNLTDAKQEVEHKMAQDKEEYERRLKYNEDLSNNLSLEVARSRDDQKNANDRLEKIKQDNQDLQGQIKQLTNTKLALEKTIAQLNQDKLVTQKKLNETEGVIQGRINEIWQIKQNLDEKISTLPNKNNGEVELPPIIVNASQGQAAATTMKTSGKAQGAVISINEPNNFAIVDLGEADGSQVGRKLTVLRDNSVIGSLEIIQVRKDISAADIKQMSVKLRVGDVVRY